MHAVPLQPHERMRIYLFESSQPCVHTHTLAVALPTYATVRRSSHLCSVLLPHNHCFIDNPFRLSFLKHVSQVSCISQPCKISYSTQSTSSTSSQSIYQLSRPRRICQLIIKYDLRTVARSMATPVHCFVPHPHFTNHPHEM